ncbi:MAG: hypothetical protein IPG09_10800 [Ignavibacteria bacterium]|nr:hypothetical protein [Ignavibacteria bacterium]
MIYEPDEVKDVYYTRYIGTGQASQENIKNLSNKLLKELGASDVTDIVNILRERDAQIIENRMLAFARKQFENLRDDFNITDLLFDKDAIRSESKIRGMFNQAFPWLRTREIPGSFKLDESAKIAEEMKPYYKQLSQNHNVDLHINKNHFIYHDIIPLNDEERVRLDEAYKAYLLGLIFGVFDIIPETETSKAIYKYTKQEGITVKRVEQLGIESRLINRLFEEQGKDALRYRILKTLKTFRIIFIAGRLAEMLAIYEYYYDEI